MTASTKHTPGPLVSVVLPVFNAAPFLDQALDSIRGQTLQNIEIICVDDGSTDGSDRILERHRAQDHRLKVIRQSNHGAGSARNKGLNEATGEFIWFPDADDFYEAGLLHLAMESASATGSDLVVLGSEELDESNGVCQPIGYAMDTNYLPGGLLSYHPLQYGQTVFQPFNGWAWDKVFRRSLLVDNHLQFQALQTTNDLFLVFAALVKAKTVSIVPDVLAHHRTNHDRSLAATRERSWICCYQALQTLKKWLVASKLYAQVRISFVNFSAALICWNLRTLKEPALSAFSRVLKERYVWSLDIAGCPWDFFYSKENYLSIAPFWINRSALSLVSHVRRHMAVIRWKLIKLQSHHNYA